MRECNLRIITLAIFKVLFSVCFTSNTVVKFTLRNVDSEKDNDEKVYLPPFTFFPCFAARL